MDLAKLALTPEKRLLKCSERRGDVIKRETARGGAGAEIIVAGRGLIRRVALAVVVVRAEVAVDRARAR
jgi:hypothetical protein